MAFCPHKGSEIRVQSNVPKKIKDRALLNGHVGEFLLSGQQLTRRLGANRLFLKDVSLHDDRSTFRMATGIRFITLVLLSILRIRQITIFLPNNKAVESTRETGV